MEILELRNKLGMTQQEVANANGMEKQKYVRVEQGQGSQLSYRAILSYLANKLKDMKYQQRSESFKAIENKYNIRILDRIDQLDTVHVSSDLKFWIICYDKLKLVRFSAKRIQNKNDENKDEYYKETDVVIEMLKELNDVNI